MTDLTDLRSEFERALGVSPDAKTIEDVRVRFLGRSGLLADRFSGLANLTPEERRSTGAALNDLKKFCESRIRDVQSRSGVPARSDSVDATLPGRPVHRGSAHPVVSTLDDICEIFGRAGFEVAAGPEVETDWYNFGALNVPADHPARDMHDTFYISKPGEFLLRTHTSPVQIHVMENKKPPVRVIAPGRVYRRDDDVSHAPMFHQVEGLWVDRNVTMRDLKGLLEYVAKSLFGSAVRLRFRPSFFPFTEPSIEVDLSCVICGGKTNCRTCKSTGWLEILGAGMVHPNVFKAVRYDPSKVTGLAFGMGVERIAMIRYAVSDIRLFYENDVRFVSELGVVS